MECFTQCNKVCGRRPKKGTKGAHPQSHRREGLIATECGKRSPRLSRNDARAGVHANQD